MSAIPEGLGRGVPNKTHILPGKLKSHVIEGEPIAVNRSQIQTSWLQILVGKLNNIICPIWEST